MRECLFIGKEKTDVKFTLNFKETGVNKAARTILDEFRENVKDFLILRDPFPLVVARLADSAVSK